GELWRYLTRAGTARRQLKDALTFIEARQFQPIACQIAAVMNGHIGRSRNDEREGNLRPRLRHVEQRPIVRADMHGSAIAGEAKGRLDRGRRAGTRLLRRPTAIEGAGRPIAGKSHRGRNGCWAGWRWRLRLRGRW